MDCGEHMTMGENSPEDVLLNAKLDKEPDKYLSLSATQYVNKQNPPIIIFHGEKDNVVPCCQGKKFYELLKAAGVKTEATFPAEGSHGGPAMYTEENLKKMVCFLNCVRKGEDCKGGCCHKPQSRIVENGGTGLFKAIMKEEQGLKEHTVFVPQDLTKFSAKNPLPILVWGNGACANSPWEHMNFLNEIASHGFIVLATGNIPMTDEWYKGPMSRSEQQIESIDWAFAQNADPQSPYYQKLDVKNICVAGMSCGGLQTLFNCADPRIKTIMICNSGLFNQQNAGQAVGGMPMPPKEKLKELHTPIMYMLGGPEDIAYGNGMDDFKRISHVPACAINFPVGHGGTYREAHGGEFTIPALAWLNWQLKGDKNAAKMFVGKTPGLLQRKDWTLEKNKLFQNLK
jgi:dienelactone hydrolase